MPQTKKENTTNAIVGKKNGVRYLIKALERFDDEKSMELLDAVSMLSKTQRRILAWTFIEIIDSEYELEELLKEFNPVTLDGIIRAVDKFKRHLKKAERLKVD